MSVECGQIDVTNIKQLTDDELEISAKAWNFEVSVARTRLKVATDNQRVVYIEKVKRLADSMKD